MRSIVYSTMRRRIEMAVLRMKRCVLNASLGVPMAHPPDMCLCTSHCSLIERISQIPNAPGGGRSAIGMLAVDQLIDIDMIN